MRILVDTEDLQRAAQSFTTIDRELGEILAGLPRDAVTVMPPTVATQVAEAVADVLRGTTDVAGRLFVRAADLRRRAVMLEVEEGRGFDPSLPGIAALALGAPFAGVAGPWLGLLALRYAGAPIGWAFTMSTGERLLDDFGTVGDALETSRDAVRGLRLSTLGRAARLPGFAKGYSWVESVTGNPAFKAFGDVATVVGGAEDVHGALDDSRGETVAGKTFTVAATVAGDVALARCPELAGADFLSGGAVRADFGAAATIDGAEISGAQRGFEQAVQAHQAELRSGDYVHFGMHVIGGATSGAVRGADAGLATWSDDVASGRYGGPMKALANVEDHFIDQHYDAIAGVASDADHAMQDAARSGARVMSGATHAISGAVSRLGGLL